MNSINNLFLKLFCQQCGFEKSEKMEVHRNPYEVKKTFCDHFDVILMKTYDKNFRLKIVFICNQCSQIKNDDLNIGKTLPNGILITNESSSFNCCNRLIKLTALLESHNNNTFNNNNFNNNNNIIINNNINNMIPNNMISNNIIPNNNMIINNNNNDKDIVFLDNDNNNIFKEIIENEKKNYEKKNIIEFDLKNKILYFLDNKSKKSYKIYSKYDLKLKDVLDDLEYQFPELELQNRKLKVGNMELNKENRINSYNLDENNIIAIY